MSSRRLTTARLSPGPIDVLVVDDDTPLRESALEVLALGGLMAAGARNGAEALAFVARETPALILLDLHMPVLDGWAFLRRRARDPALARIPVLVLSGEPHDAPLPGPVAGWIAKPFGEDELLEAVNRLLRSGRAETAAMARRRS
jgi:CheY-like chemotaxis protein